MRNKKATIAYYTTLGFKLTGEYEAYLIFEKDEVEIHFFEFKNLKPLENYGQVYIRVKQIEKLYQTIVSYDIAVHPNGALEQKPWGQIEFALLDPDHNLLTFGEEIERKDKYL